LNEREREVEREIFRRVGWQIREKLFRGESERDGKRQIERER
jgi:hypothetical protein